MLEAILQLLIRLLVSHRRMYFISVRMSWLRYENLESSFEYKCNKVTVIGTRKAESLSVLIREVVTLADISRYMSNIFRAYLEVYY